MEKQRTKTEAELIATVANIPDAEGCLLFAQRATKRGMSALAAACEDRAKILKSLSVTGVKKTPSSHAKTTPAPMKTHRTAKQALPMKTHRAAEEALPILIEDYKAGAPPTNYGGLAQRCGYSHTDERWFGQVTDLIDAACALAGVPSFALARVREANGNVNRAAWRKEYSHLRDRVIAAALGGSWTVADFTKIQDALAVFSARRLGNKKAWGYVHGQINVEDWADGGLVHGTS
jgi:hypothetical protein